MPITLTSPDVPVPTYAHPDDAGLDLATPTDIELAPNRVELIGTGIRVALPPGTVGLIVERSSLHLKGLHLANTVGVIDAGYRGELKLAIANTTSRSVDLAAGDRLAQLLVIPIVRPDVHQVSAHEFDEHHSTARGAGGFGSTGA